jgi:hypothetical protein
MPASLAVAPASPWESVGHTSIDNVLSFASDGGTATTLGTLQNKALRTTYAARTDSIAITLEQFDRKSLRLYYGSNAPLLADGSLGVPADPDPTNAAFLVIVADGANRFGIYAPKTEIFRGDVIAVKDAESLVGLPLSIKPLQYVTNTWTYALTPLGGIAPTGATAGTPGAFTPAGADLPANLAAMTGITASPTTAWTAGQYVQCDDGSKVHWSSTAWVAGVA